MYTIPKGRDAVAPWPGVRSRRSTSPRSETGAGRAAADQLGSQSEGPSSGPVPLRIGRHRRRPGQHLVRAESYYSEAEEK